jgi:hypothetical protein
VKTINDRLALIKDRSIKLQETRCTSIDADPHKPSLRLWAPTDISRMGDQFVMTLTVKGMWSQQERYVEFTPDQARLFAAKLIEMADAMDACITDAIEPEEHRHEWVSDASGLVDECKICGELRA